MTEIQKNLIEEYRKNGCSYSSIAHKLDISVNSIKTYCRRNGLSGFSAVRSIPDSNFEFCRYCGKPVVQKSSRKAKKYCSDICRMAWWNSHQEDVNRKAVYNLTCINCGNLFASYGNAGRKYCCHRCYILHRFGGNKNA